MAMQQVINCSYVSYIIRARICEYADTLEFISLNRTFRCGFCYFDENFHYLFWYIISDRARRIAIRVSIAQRPVFEAILAIRDHWNEEIDYEAW